MENEVVLQVEGLRGKTAKDNIILQISKMPGVELVDVNLGKGWVSVTGGDLDQLQLVDIIESLGYTTLH